MPSKYTTTFIKSGNFFAFSKMKNTAIIEFEIWGLGKFVLNFGWILLNVRTMSEILRYLVLTFRRIHRVWNSELDWSNAFLTFCKVVRKLEILTKHDNSWLSEEFKSFSNKTQRRNISCFVRLFHFLMKIKKRKKYSWSVCLFLKTYLHDCGHFGKIFRHQRRS